MASLLIGGGIVGGALVSGIAGIMGANTMASAQNNATAVQQGIYNQQQANLAPYNAAGVQALGQIQANMPTYNKPFSMTDFTQNDPGYQFRLEQGQNATDRAAANSGGVGGASYLRDLGSYSQGFASNEYQNAFQRYQEQIQNSYSRLAGVAGIGQSGAQTQAQTGTTAGQGIGASTAATGAAQAAGPIGVGTAINQGVGTGINAYQSQQLINALAAKNGVASIGRNPAGTDSPL
jgi:hypothetical protein